MRRFRVAALGLLVSGGCVVQSNSSAVAPQAPPTPPPSAFNHPGYVYYGGGQPPPIAPAAPMPPAPSVPVAMNLAHLRAVAMQPARCNLPREVAPGVFVHFDCYPYRRVAVAVKHATQLKLNVMRSGSFKWNSRALGNVHGFAPTPMGASAPTQQPYPDLVDHRLSGTEGPVKSQGDVGACTAFALSAVMDGSLRRANQNVTTSPEHVWSHYGVPTMEDAAAANLNKTITTNDALPYNGREACEITRDASDDCGETYGVRPNSAASDAPLEQRLRAADAASGHRVIAFEELQVSPPNIDEIVATLASGADLWVGFNVDSSAWINGRMQNDVIPDWSVADGGHAVAMAGYRKVNGSYQFLIHNSWGIGWGDRGYAWVTQAMVERWMHLAYKVRTDVDPGSPSSPVTPKTDEDCPGDQVLDSVTNRCVGVCPDQSRPANGQCPNGPAPPPQPLPLPVIPGVPSLPGIPPIPGWFPAPAQQPAQPGQQPAQPQLPNWPWPVPSTLPPFLQPPSGK